MRRWSPVCAAMLAVLLATPQAVSATAVPLPRAKPKVAAVKTSPAINIPKPRPKPKRAGEAKPAPKTTQVVNSTARGRLEVKLDELGRERDPLKASNLAPKIETKWSKAQITEARRRCEIVLAATNVDAKPVKPVGGPDGCGIAAPIQVSSFGAVSVKPAARLNCTMAATLYKWVVDTVQPAARKSFKQPVVEIQNMASYQCRARRGVGGGRISEHSFGNALDIGSFTLANGQKLTVLDDWSSTLGFFGFDAKAGFLSKTHQGACGLFATVLGPKANKAHENHFHFDLGRAGRYKICQ